MTAPDPAWANSLAPGDSVLASRMYRAGIPVDTIARCFQLDPAVIHASIYASEPPKVPLLTPPKAYRGFCGCITFAKDEDTAWTRLFADHAADAPPGFDPKKDWGVVQVPHLDHYWHLNTRPTSAMDLAMGRVVECPCCARSLRFEQPAPDDWKVGPIGTPVSPVPVMAAGPRVKLPGTSRLQRLPVDSVWGVQEVVCASCWPSYAKLVPGLIVIRRRRFVDAIENGGQEIDPMDDVTVSFTSGSWELLRDGATLARSVTK